MLELINRYAHGFVAIPVILACQEKGVFRLLKNENTLTLEQLSKGLGANSGHLQVALRLMESLQWVSCNKEKAFRLEAKSKSHRKIPKEILDLYRFPMDSYLTQSKERRRLDKWINLSQQRWKVADSLLADFLDGVLVLPLLITLKRYGLLEDVDKDEHDLFSKISPPAREEVARLFGNQGWTEENGGCVQLTDAGRFMVERTLITGVTVSYTPLLSSISHLLFGDIRHVFGSDEGGNERHIDRTLNVIGSGFQHERYFADVKEIFLSIFNRLPIEEQPKYVADMGCGDGSLLKKLYEVIRSQSIRGKALNQYPVTMIGMDYNERALEETKKTLSNVDIPHLLIRADVGNPEEMKEDLKGIGIEGHENILHVRSFLDHNRPFIYPQDHVAVASRRNLGYGGVYVDEKGRAIESARMAQSLVEHLQRWSSVINKHGLILLEVHSVEDPELISHYLDKSENLHFDAYHAFSRQYLVEADVFLMAAAEVGLFPNADFFRRYPKTLPFSRITLNLFEKRPYQIRFARTRDIPVLVELETTCWSKPLRASKSEIQRRLNHFPIGQCVVEWNSRIVGVVYTQKIKTTEDLFGVQFPKVSSLHTASGNVLQLLGINIASDYQDLGLGDQLLEFILQRSSLMKAIDHVVGVTRCRDFAKSRGHSFEEYLSVRNEQGHLLDPTLRFHVLHGAQIKGVLNGYRPQDRDNEGKGVLISYDIRSHEVHAKKNKQSGKASTQIRESIENNVLEIVKRSIAAVMREPSAYSVEKPLMEMGLDSADLLELRILLSTEFGIELEPTIFFEYATPSKLADYFKSKNSFKDESVSKSFDYETIKAAKPTLESETFSNHDFVQSNSEDSIAIIGMACRFPGGVNSPEDFWSLLYKGQDAIEEIPGDRWNWDRYFDAKGNKAGKMVSRWGGFLTNVDKFDPQFFGISAKEARLMDPQQRLLLQVSWEALEQACINPKTLVGSSTGVFTGIFTHDYEWLQLKISRCQEVGAYFGSGTSMSVAAGRISYVFGFEGPALAVNTACSSSLVAVHEACQSIRNAECDLALACGVNLILSPELSIAFSQAGMLATDGRCKVFDSTANGYVRSEGCAVVVLKLFSKAIKERNTVLAVIRGSAINQDGASNGLTAPNGRSQEKLLHKALQVSGLKAEDISYIEAHGTGTYLGDPVELKAIQSIYNTKGAKDNPLVIGSVKTNIGHTEAAAGLAGLIKVVLSMRHQCIPAHLHFKELNPQINLDDFPVLIPKKALKWNVPDRAKTRIAGVSSFGFSGTNAHVIVEEYLGGMKGEGRRAKEIGIKNKGSYLIVLSAKNEDRLKEVAKNLHSYLTMNGEPSRKRDGRPAAVAGSNATDNIPETVNLPDLAYTLQVGREAMEERLAIFVRSVQELEENLKDFIEGQEDIENLYHGTVKSNTHSTATFTNNEDITKTLDDWVTEGKYAKLLEFWVGGAIFDWNKLYGESQPHRLSLPTYPFAKKRYWIRGKVENHSQPADVFEDRRVIRKAGIFHDRTKKSGPKKELSKPSGISLIHPSSFFSSGLNQLVLGRKKPFFPVLKQIDPLTDLKSAMPENTKGIVPTLNRTGVMLENLMPCSEAFAEFAGQCDGEVLDLGCAYGIATIAALEHGARVLAVDMEQQHLDILKDRIREEAGQRLSTQRGLLPEINFEEERFAAIHTSRVLHFLKPEDVQKAIQKMYRWLQPEGKLFVITDSPYMGYWKSKAPEYEARKTAGDLWPGYIENVGKYFDARDVDGAPSLINPMDPDILRREFEAVGFDVETVGFEGTVTDQKIEESKAGMEHVEITAMKPIDQAWSENDETVVRDKPIIQSLKDKPLLPASERGNVKVYETIDEIRKTLRRGLAHELEMELEEVDEEKQFVDMGLDSIIGVTWIRRINTKYGLSISATKVYDYPNIQKLARFLEKELKTCQGGLDQKPLKSTNPLSKPFSQPPSAISSKKSHYSVQSSARLSYPRIFQSEDTGSEIEDEHTQFLENAVRHPLPRLNRDQLNPQETTISNSSDRGENTESIAIVGMSGRYPGASDLDHYWNNLAQGKNSIREIPLSRWDVNAYYDPRPSQKGKIFSKWIGLLDEVASFDPLFFNISPREAEVMDPQHRLFLQEGYKAFEDSGYNQQTLSDRKCGVYLGIMSSEYGQLLDHNQEGSTNTTGNSYAIAAARIAYYLNLKGPAISIDTACSSSLVATHLACQALLSQETNMALVGGISLFLTPAPYIDMCSAGMLSPEGQCKTFDDSANGIVPGEGVGCLVLKRLRDAEADQDTIYGIIIGSGINQDGKTNGITAPSVTSQMELEREIYDKCKIDPASISYVEMHGTGTKLGDPIELEALSTVFKERTDRKNFCAIGSVKSNIGHPYEVFQVLNTPLLSKKLNFFYFLV